MQNHKAFSEREQLVSSRYKLNTLSSNVIPIKDGATAETQVTANVMQADKISEQEVTMSLPKNVIVSTQQMHSIKSNSELFPPIDNKHV